MTPPWKWRKKAASAFDLVVVPVGDTSGKTRRYHLTRGRLALLAAGIVLVCVVATLAAVTFTPLMGIVPVPASVLEVRYGKQLFETQERLKGLAEDVLVLKGYNLQLRKALGEKTGSDTVRVPSKTTKAQDASARVEQPRESVTPPSATQNRSVEDLDLMATVEPSTPVMQPATVTAREVALPLLLPTEGFLTQAFDPAHGHLGIDIAGKQGTAVLAAADGIMIFSGWTYEDGNTVILSHGSGYMTVYKHNQLLLRTAPSAVRRGDPVALLGTSGRTSLGPHLHFELWRDGVALNPNQFLLTPVGAQ